MLSAMSSDSQYMIDIRSGKWMLAISEQGKPRCNEKSAIPDYNITVAISFNGPSV